MAEVNEENQPANTHVDSDLPPEQQLQVRTCVGAWGSSDTMTIKNMFREVLGEYKLDSIHSQLVEIKKSISFTQYTGNETLQKTNSNMAEIDTMKATIESHKGQITHEHEAYLKLDIYSRRSNPKFYGIEEKLRETDTDREQAVRDVVSGKLGIDPNFPIERCHHMGVRPSGDTTRSRLIIVRLSFFRDHENIWKQKGALQI